MSADTAIAPPQLRPLALGEILDVSIKLVTRNWRALATVVLVVTVPVGVISLLITTSTTSYDPLLDVRTADDGAAYVAGALVNALLQLLLYLLAPAACTALLADAYLGRRPEWQPSLATAARRAPAVFAMSVAVGLGLLVGFTALVIPAIFLGVRWSVALPALLLERRGPFAAIGRSWSLVGGFWWKCFGTVFVAYLLVIVLSFATGAVLGAVLALLASTDSFLGISLQELVTVGVELFALPLLAAVTLVLYVDLRVRKEGFDLALAADHMAASQPVEAVAPEQPFEPARHPAFGE